MTAEGICFRLFLCKEKTQSRQGFLNLKEIIRIFTGENEKNYDILKKIE